MKVSDQDVLYVSELANLELTEAERQRMVRDLNSILEYVDRLDKLDTSAAEPMASVAARCASGHGFAHAQREDQPGPSLAHEAALQNAPDSDGTFFCVPKVIER